jgi:hypothetical protein
MDKFKYRYEKDIFIFFILRSVGGLTLSKVLKNIINHLLSV